MGKFAVENFLLLVACACIVFLRLCPAPEWTETRMSDNMVTEWHGACLLIVGFLLFLVYFDDTPVVLTYDSHTTKLLGTRRWYTLATQGYTALLLYLVLSVLHDCGLKSRWAQRTAGHLLAIAHTTSAFVAIAATFVLIPAYHRVGKWAKLGFGGRPRPLYLYNSGLLITMGELTLTGRILSLRHLPAVLLFAVWFCACHMKLLKEDKVCVYTPLDYHKASGLLAHACALALFALLFGLELLVNFISNAAPLGRLFTHVAILACTLLLVPLREPKKAQAENVEKAEKADKSE